MTLIHLRVSDSVTQKPVPVRIRVADLLGNSFHPLGRQQFFLTGPHMAVGGQVAFENKKYYYIDGACEINLPPGVYSFEITKGERFHKVFKNLEIKQGQAALRINIERKTNSPWENRISGDARCHDFSWPAAVLEGSSEGLDLVHLLACENILPGTDIVDASRILDFSGQEVAFEKFGCSLFVNTLNHHPFLGTIGIIHSHRPVFPLVSSSAESPEVWSVVDWCRQGHRKNGLITWVFDPTNEFQGEALAALILNEIDLFEISNLSLDDNSPVLFWYMLLNAGVKANAIGASGKKSNAVFLGNPKTWTKTPSLSDSPAHLFWLESVRKGDSFFSVGPFLELTIITLTPLIEIQLIAHDLSPEDEIELVIDGNATKIERDKSLASVTIIRELDPSKFEWVCGRVISSHNDKPDLKAHTNPLFSSNRKSTRSQEKAFAIKKLEVLFINTEAWLRTLGPKEKKRVDQILDILAEAKAKLACGN
jgi:hypothetical protein